MVAALNHRSLPLLGLALLLSVTAAPLADGEVGSDPLAALTQPVTVTIEEGTIGEALAALNVQTGVSLMAALPAEKLRVSLAVTEQPLGEVLAHLAQMCGLRWHTAGGMYILSPANFLAMPNWQLVDPWERFWGGVRLVCALAGSLSVDQVGKLAAGGLPFSALAVEQKALFASFLEAADRLSTTYTPSGGGEPRTVELPPERWVITEASRGAQPLEVEFDAECVFQPGEQGFEKTAAFGVAVSIGGGVVSDGEPEGWDSPPE